MSAIWKFIVPVGGGTVMMPCSAEILSAHAQRGELAVWASVEPSAVRAPRRFAAYRTGDALPLLPGGFVGTVFLGGGKVVIHVFDLGEAS